MNTIILQIFHAKRWHDAIELRVASPDQGYFGDIQFAYLSHYACEFLNVPIAAGSCRYPVNYEALQESRWPAFLLDILPSGAGRTHWLRTLGLREGAGADWQLLLHGAGNPPGHLRIAGTEDRRALMVPTVDGSLIANRDHPGFARTDILDRQQDFIEYAVQNGAQVAGGSDVQGVAPKFMLQQDCAGRFHAEGVLEDAQVTACWIVKFPRGRTEEDRLVLRNEAAYVNAAGQVGLRVNSTLTTWDSNALFIPRFDRVIHSDSMERFGLESLCSLAGVSEFGANIAQDTLALCLIEHATNPEMELKEFIRRDVYNLALGNTDNHARNSAVLRYPDGRVALSPLYDVAPMFKDPEVIARVCRWKPPLERGGIPDWGLVAEYAGKLIPTLDAAAFRRELAQWADQLERLPDTLSACGADDSLIELLVRKINAQAAALRSIRPQTIVT